MRIRKIYFPEFIGTSNITCWITIAPVALEVVPFLINLCGAPEPPIVVGDIGARVVGLAHVDEGELASGDLPILVQNCGTNSS